MYKPDHLTAVGGQYSEGQPSVQAATIVTAEHKNAITNELCNAIQGFGDTLVKADSTQLYTVLAREFRARTANAALASLKRAKDTNLSVELRALAREPLNYKVVVAVGDSAGISISGGYSSHNFSTATAAASYSGDFADVLYDAANDLFIATGTVGEIQTASPATPSVWTRRANGGSDIRALATNGAGVTIAVGEAEFLKRSVNGTSWASVTSPFAGTPDIVSAAYGAGVFVIATGKGDLASSVDGSAWAVRQALAGSEHDPACVRYEETLGFIYHHGTDVYRSGDGVSWVKIHDDVILDSADNPPGLLLLPGAWVVGFADADGTSADGRYSVTDVDADLDFSASYVLDEPVNWWRVIDGQLWAVGGDKVYAGGAV